MLLKAKSIWSCVVLKSNIFLVHIHIFLLLQNTLCLPKMLIKNYSVNFKKIMKVFFCHIDIFQRKYNLAMCYALSNSLAFKE